jgi:hypothetical protein
MDTRYWGPHGWKFLHTLPYSYPMKPTKIEQEQMKEFLVILKEMLPCKYFRQSYSQYITELPPDDFLKSRTMLEKWLYLIHNKVNNKLRSQGLIKYEDPSITHVRNQYSFIYQKCVDEYWKIPGIDFIFIIAFHYRNTKIENKLNKYKKFFEAFSNIAQIPSIRSCIKKEMNERPFETEGKKLGAYRWFAIIYSKCKDIGFFDVTKCREDCNKNVSGCKKKSFQGKTCRKLKPSEKNKTIKRKQSNKKRKTKRKNKKRKNLRKK